MEERNKLLIERSNLAVLLQNQRMYGAGAHFPADRATNGFDRRRPLFKPVELDADHIGYDDDSDDDSQLRLHHESKRRLTKDQVRLLENSFELDNKLDPQRKAHLAKALRLKPRQIAIWFQNRRARWKTKQLEKDYEALRSIYQTLEVDCQRLIKEKEQLEAEVLSLTKKLVLKERTTNSSTILEDSEEGYNSMLMELTGSSNAFRLDDDNNNDNSDHRPTSQIGEDDSCGYGLLWS